MTKDPSPRASLLAWMVGLVIGMLTEIDAASAKTAPARLPLAARPCQVTDRGCDKTDFSHSGTARTRS
jgi:hypothetical protein